MQELFEIRGGVLIRCRSVVANAVIPDGVRRIAAGAFMDEQALTSVVIPGSVEYIGDRAFYGCPGLVRVTMADGVRAIGQYAFAGCGRLEEAVVPDSVRIIGWGAFEGCGMLRAVNVPSAADVHGDAFAGCEGMDAASWADVVRTCPEDFLQYVPEPLLAEVEANAGVHVPFSCPETGAFEAWKRCRAVGEDRDVLVHLRIPANARRSSGFGNGCRADRAEVIGIHVVDGGAPVVVARSQRDSGFLYEPGKVVVARGYDPHRWHDCVPGIHFVMRYEDALAANY